MFLRFDKRLRSLIGFFAGVCATVLFSGVAFNTQPAVGEHVRKGVVSYSTDSAPAPHTRAALDFQASHQAPNFYN
jgi:hypothetical protein